MSAILWGYPLQPSTYFALVHSHELLKQILQALLSQLLQEKPGPSLSAGLKSQLQSSQAVAGAKTKPQAAHAAFQPAAHLGFHSASNQLPPSFKPELQPNLATGLLQGGPVPNPHKANLVQQQQDTQTSNLPPEVSTNLQESDREVLLQPLEQLSHLQPYLSSEIQPSASSDVECQLQQVKQVSNLQLNVPLDVQVQLQQLSQLTSLQPNLLPSLTSNLQSLDIATQLQQLSKLSHLQPTPPHQQPNLQPHLPSAPSLSSLAALDRQAAASAAQLDATALSFTPQPDLYGALYAAVAAIVKQIQLPGSLLLY